jgi:mercuric ion transport protein
MSESKKSNLGMMGAVGAAVGASACCTIPLALVTMGAGGAWVGTFTAMQPYRPYFIGIAVLSLGFAGFREYKRSREIDCDCEEGLSTRMRRALLVLGLVVTTSLIASPWIIRGSAAYNTAITGVQETELKEVVLNVSGMTCAACPITVSKALTNLDGVEEARVTYEPPEAVVLFDPQKVSVEDMATATKNVGYPAKVRTNGLDKIVLNVSGMTCAACPITVSKALTNLDGVEEARVTYEPPEAVVIFDPLKVSIEDMEAATKNVGYPAKQKTD